MFALSSDVHDLLNGEIELDKTYFGEKRKGRRGSIAYTDKFRSHDALMFCGYKHLRVDHKKRFCNGKVYINGLEGFLELY